MALLENIILEVDGMLPDLESIFAARKTEAVYFAIRQKSTGHFLPQARKARRGGFTHDTPVSQADQPPRLFKQKQHADSALRWWLKGETVETWSDATPDGADPELITTPKADRIAADMEVVPATLIVQG